MSDLKLRTLLIVEDEVDLLDILRTEIESWGVFVEVAGSAAQALEILNSKPVTAILSDISMPGGSGLELLEMVRASGRNLPFLFLTAFDRKDFLLKAMHLGAIDFLEKPFESKQLKEAIFKALEIGVRLEKVDDCMRTQPQAGEIAKQMKMVNMLRASHAKKSRQAS